MSATKRVLLAYDGSAGAEAAVAALSNAGMSDDSEVMILCVVEVWVPPSGAIGIENEALLPDDICGARRRALDTIRAKDNAVARVGESLQAAHPTWTIQTVTSVGPVPQLIVALARQWNADLIMLGSRKRSFLERLLFHSVSRQVLHAAPCVVQVVKAPTQKPSGGARPKPNSSDPIRLIAVA